MHCWGHRQGRGKEGKGSRVGRGAAGVAGQRADSFAEWMLLGVCMVRR